MGEMKVGNTRTAFTSKQIFWSPNTTSHLLSRRPLSSLLMWWCGETQTSWAPVPVYLQQWAVTWEAEESLAVWNRWLDSNVEDGLIRIKTIVDWKEIKRVAVKTVEDGSYDCVHLIQCRFRNGIHFSDGITIGNDASVQLQQITA
jgi:hypothetical protein